MGKLSSTAYMRLQLLLITILDVALLLLLALRSSSAVSNTALMVYLIATTGLIIAAGLAANVMTTRLGALRTTAFYAGLLMGALFLADLVAEYLISSQTIVSAATGLLIVAVLAVVGGTGWVAARRARSISRGVLASLLAMLIAILLLLAFGFTAEVLFGARLNQLLRPEFIPNVQASDYGAATTIENAFTHLTEAPALALLFGGIGAFLGMRFRGQVVEKA